MDAAKPTYHTDLRIQPRLGGTREWLESEGSWGSPAASRPPKRAPSTVLRVALLLSQPASRQIAYLKMAVRVE
jgi:hypothetical protein